MADLSSTRVFGKLTVLHEAILKANAEITGGVTASSFAGDGSLLTNLNASNLTSGTVPEARLPASALVGDTTYSAGTGITLSGTTFGLTDESYTSAEKNKLANIEAGAEVNVATNLGQSRNATSYTVTSSTGTNTTLAAATTSAAGVMTSTDKAKLDGIQAGAGANWYLDGLTFNTTDGVLTASVNGTTNQTVDLDGRYLLSGAKAADSDKLDGKHASSFAEASHTHPWSGITSKPATATRWPTFSEVTGKPTTYPPSSHNHDTRYVRTDSDSTVNGLLSFEGQGSGLALGSYQQLQFSVSLRSADTPVPLPLPTNASDVLIYASTGGTGTVTKTVGRFYKTGTTWVYKRIYGGTGSNQPHLLIADGVPAIGATHGSPYAYHFQYMVASINGADPLPFEFFQEIWHSGNFDPASKANTSGTYSGLRAQATTKADVGLSGIPNTNGSTSNYLRGDGSWVTPKVQQESQTVSVTTGQTTINLTTITVSSASLPTITVDGYYGVELIRDFTVTNSTTITLGSPIQANGQLTVTNYVAS